MTALKMNILPPVRSIHVELYSQQVARMVGCLFGILRLMESYASSGAILGGYFRWTGVITVCM